MAWPNSFTPIFNYPQQQPNFSWTTTYSPSSQTPVNGVIKVSGRESVDAYQLPPNSNMPFFDENKDVVYIKSTDGVGVPTVTEFSIAPIVSTPSYQTDNELLSRFTNLEQELTNAIDRIKYLESTISNQTNSQQSSTTTSELQANDENR